VFSRRPIPVATLVVAAVAFLSSPVHAGFVSVAGDGNILNPGATATGATPDFFNDVGANRVVHGWAEKQNFVLEHDLFVDAIHAGRYNHRSDLGGYNQLKIDKGTVINSQLLSFDPLRRHSVSNVTFTFDAPILGVIVSSNRFRHSGHPSRDYLFASDFLGNPRTTYPTHHYRARGLELKHADSFVISELGDSITLNLTAHYPGDQIRVITVERSRSLEVVPAPSAIILASAGLATVGIGRLVRQKRRLRIEHLSS
jgi:hypothetical protein